MKEGYLIVDSTNNRAGKVHVYNSVREYKVKDDSA